MQHMGYEVKMVVTVVVRLLLAIFAGWVLSSHWNWPMVSILIIACAFFSLLPLFKFVDVVRPEEDFFGTVLCVLVFFLCTLISGRSVTLPGLIQGYGWAGWIVPAQVAIMQGIVLFRQFRNYKHQKNGDQENCDFS